MSSAQDLQEIWSDLKDLPEDLQKSITSKFSKLSGLKQLTGETAVQRDGARLDAKTRACYRNLGLDVEDEVITNILADNITISDSNRVAAGPQKHAPTDVVEPAPKPDPKPLPKPEPLPVAPPNQRMPTWAAVLLGAAVSALPAAGALGYLINRDDGGAAVVRTTDKMGVNITVRDMEPDG